MQPITLVARLSAPCPLSICSQGPLNRPHIHNSRFDALAKQHFPWPQSLVSCQLTRLVVSYLLELCSSLQLHVDPFANGVGFCGSVACPRQRMISYGSRPGSLGVEIEEFYVSERRIQCPIFAASPIVFKSDPRCTHQIHSPRAV